MKRKLAFISVLLGLALIGVVALKAKPTKTANAAAGWRFVTNQDGSIGIVRASADPSWHIVGQVSTNR